MPFKSQAQRAKFYADPKLRKYIPDFEASTPKGKLPKHVGDKSSQIHKAAVNHMKRRK